MSRVNIKRELKSILSITKASVLSLLRNPSSIIFGFIFPIIFISIFGLLGSSGSSIDVYITSNTDKETPIYKALDDISAIEFTDYSSKDEATTQLSQGKIDGIVEITQTTVNGIPKYTVNLQTSDASPENGGLVSSILSSIVNSINLSQVPQDMRLASFNQTTVVGREYKQIDFILPGQLGFSLLNTGIFGTAFVLLMLKDTLVLKRFFATPIKKASILIAEGLSRLLYSGVQTLILIVAGHYLFGFTLVNGVSTLVQMMVLSLLGLIVFLGMGFLVSSISKNQNAISTIANLFTLPQMLLSGTFFPATLLPEWLQIVSKALPLTHMNNAMRAIAFEGASFSTVLPDIYWLLGWTGVIYVVASYLFKWDE